MTSKQDTAELGGPQLSVDSFTDCSSVIHLHPSVKRKAGINISMVFVNLVVFIEIVGVPVGGVDVVVHVGGVDVVVVDVASFTLPIVVPQEPLLLLSFFLWWLFRVDIVYCCKCHCILLLISL